MARKKKVPINYQEELKDCPDRSKIEKVLEQYPEDDGRKNHNHLSIDAGIYESLQRDINDVSDDEIRRAIIAIARFFLDINNDPKYTSLIMLAATGHSLRQIAGKTGLAFSTVKSRLEKIRAEHGRIGEAIYPTKETTTVRYPGGSLTA